MEERLIQFELLPPPLDVLRVHQWIQADTDGAQVIFVGTVRNRNQGKRVIALEFETYESMAIAELNRIASEIYERWPVHRIVLHHVIGRCEVGEAPVIAAIGAAHRQEAFEACQYLMNRLKQSVPIWKKEIAEDGEIWVSATP